MYFNKQVQHGHTSFSDNMLLSPLLSKLWSTFLQHIHRSSLTVDDILATLSYCFNLPSTMTGQTRILFDSFIAAKLLLPKYDDQNTSDIVYVVNPLDQQQANGFLVGLSHCYAASCKPTQPTCYAPTCPHKIYTQWLSVYNQVHQDLIEKENQQDSWTQHVPCHILQTYPSREIKRQSAIAELLQSELDYCQDLTILEQVYAHPFATAHLLNKTRRDKFYAIVFKHALDLRSYHHRICYELVRHRQDPFLLFVDFVGNALLQHTSYLVEPYISYAGHHVEAKYILENETYHRVALRRWFACQDEDQRVRKLGIKHFLSRPTFRIAKYKLQLEAIAKYSDHMADQVALSAAIDTLHDLLNQMNEAIRKAESHIYLLRITSSLVPSSIVSSLNLLPKYQQQYTQLEDQCQHHPVTLLHEDRFRLTRLSSHSIRAQVCHVFLFSHVLLVTKPRGQEGHEKFILIGRPIPLPMLCVSILPSSIIRRLSNRIATSPQFQSLTLSSQVINRKSHDIEDNNSSSDNSSNCNDHMNKLTLSTDLRHRFSLTSTTSSSSSWSTESSSSTRPSSSSSSSASSLPSSSESSPSESLLMSFPLKFTRHRTSSFFLSPLGKSTAVDWLEQPVKNTPTVTGLHVRARLIRRWHHLKRAHQTYPEPLSTRSTAVPQCHHHNPRRHQITTFPLQSATTPTMTPVNRSFLQPSPLGFQRRNSFLRYSSSLLGRRSSLFFKRSTLPCSSPITTASCSSTSPNSSTTLSSPLVLLTQQGTKTKTTSKGLGFQGGHTRFTLRHLAYPENSFDIRCKNPQQKNQWYAWIQSAMEASAAAPMSPRSHITTMQPTLDESDHFSSSSSSPSSSSKKGPPFRLDLICQVPAGSTHSININGDRKIPAGCGRIYCSLPFVTTSGNPMIALGTQHGFWVAARDGAEEEFQLIEMMECHQMAELNGHLVVRSHHTLKSYSLTQLAALLSKSSPSVSSPSTITKAESDPLSPTSPTSPTSASTAYPFQSSTCSTNSSLPSEATTLSSTTTANTNYSFSSTSVRSSTAPACFPLSISSVTIKRSSVLDFAVGVLYGCPVLCYLSRTRRRRKQLHRRITHSSYFKWFRSLVIYTVKPSSSKRSSDILSLKKEKIIPLTLEDAVSIGIHGDKVYIRSASQGIECVDVLKEQSTLLSCNEEGSTTAASSPTEIIRQSEEEDFSREDDENDNGEQKRSQQPPTHGGIGDKNINKNHSYGITTSGISTYPTTSTNHWVDIIHLPFDTYNSDDFALLCSQQAAWMINKRRMNVEVGESVIHFEADVKSVAMVYPYLILFSTCIIEIRHIETGEMVQVIPGYHIRCVHSSVDKNNPRSSSVIHFTMLMYPEDRVYNVYQLVL